MRCCPTRFRPTRRRTRWRPPSSTRWPPHGRARVGPDWTRPHTHGYTAADGRAPSLRPPRRREAADHRGGRRTGARRRRRGPDHPCDEGQAADQGRAVPRRLGALDPNRRPPGRAGPLPRSVRRAPQHLVRPRGQRPRRARRPHVAGQPVHGALARVDQPLRRLPREPADERAAPPLPVERADDRRRPGCGPRRRAQPAPAARAHRDPSHRRASSSVAHRSSSDSSSTSARCASVASISSRLTRGSVFRPTTTSHCPDASSVSTCRLRTDTPRNPCSALTSAAGSSPVERRNDTISDRRPNCVRIHRRTQRNTTSDSSAATVTATAAHAYPSPTASPIAAVTHIDAAVVRPRTEPPCLRIAPPPRKPTPTTTCEATRVMSICTLLFARTATNGANACTEMSPNSAAPRHSRTWVRNPAGWASISRSTPIAAPSATARSTRRTISPSPRFSTDPSPLHRPGEAYPAPGSGLTRARLVQRRPCEEQALLTHVAEAHHRLRLVALADEVEDHTFTELLVQDVVADAQPELLGAARARRRARAPHRAATTAAGALAAQRRRHDRVAVTTEAAPLTLLAERVHELLGDLGEEPARRVVVGRAEEAAAPRMAQVQALPRPCDPHVAEATFLLELVGLAQTARVREHAVLEPREEHDRELETLRGVERHQGHGRAVVAVGLLVVGGLVHVGDERDAFEERLHTRQPGGDLWR